MSSSSRSPVRIPPSRSQSPREKSIAVAGSDAPPSSSAGKSDAQQHHLPVPHASASLVTHGQRMEAELERLAQRLQLLVAQVRQSQKLASLGATAAVLAHEFNNLFTPIVAYSRQALDTDDVPLMRKTLEKTLSQIDIVWTMCDRVVGMARQSDDRIKPVNVSSVATNAIECLCRDLAKDNIAVAMQIDPELTVCTNEGTLLQVLFNLVINARQAMLGRRGRLTVDAVAVNERVQINVRDTGCGIAPENLDRVFEPFFSTKTQADRPDRRGLGLGLCICREMIEELGGSIRVVSEASVGTTFTIELPSRAN
ncbi:MAG: HAMP domain-containing histidine kinase [Phycisphaerae bacterium]|nr:HAMP domain-containing histidine kinase [Phycisphaerae bacterium]